MINVSAENKTGPTQRGVEDEASLRHGRCSWLITLLDLLRPGESRIDDETTGPTCGGRNTRWGKRRHTGHTAPNPWLFLLVVGQQAPEISLTGERFTLSCKGQKTFALRSWSMKSTTPPFSHPSQHRDFCSWMPKLTDGQQKQPMIWE